MNKNTKIYIAGHRGLVGSALVRRLEAGGYTNLVTRSHAELDLCDPRAVAEFFAAERPEVVLLAAARVGGILANDTYPADFIRENLLIQTNVIHQSFVSGVKKLLFLGSSCIYPRLCPQPMKEEYLLTGPLEPTNSAYAVAKIAGIEMCRSYNRQHGTFFLPVMPTNLYGPNDNFDLENSHVLPALLRKIHLGKCLADGDWEAFRADLNARPVNGVDGNADRAEIIAVLARHGIHAGNGQRTDGRGQKQQEDGRRKTEDGNSKINPSSSASPPSVLSPLPSVSVWGSGTVRREFLHADDMAAACVFLLENAATPDLVNIGTGTDVTVAELAGLIKAEVGYKGKIVFDETKPNGTPRKLLDVSKIEAMGWRARIGLVEGIGGTCRWLLERKRTDDRGRKTEKTVVSRTAEDRGRRTEDGNCKSEYRYSDFGFNLELGP
jgi:GDP-L-fucose synthase